MTTYAENDSRTTAGWPMYAALGAGTSLVLTAVGTFWDVTGNDTTDGDDGASYLFIVAVVLLSTALVYGLVVRTATAASAGTRAVVLAVIAFLSLIAFWSGLPAVLAFGAVALAMKANQGGGLPTTAKVAVGISVVTTVLAVLAAVAG